MKENALGVHEIIAEDPSLKLIPNLLTMESSFSGFWLSKSRESIRHILLINWAKFEACCCLNCGI